MSRVLVVEDSLTVRTLVHLTLRKVGHEIDLAGTGTEGIARARRARPDVILLDFMLPDMKGIDVAKALLNDPGAKTSPIIVMTAKSDEVRAIFTGIATVVDFLKKPFPASALLQAVDRVVSRPAVAEPKAAPAPSVHLAPAQIQEIARGIFARMHEGLAKIPEWLPQLGTSQPAPFFARKLLTSDVVEGLVATMSPYAQGLNPAAPGRLGGGDGTILLEGDLGLIPVLGLLRILGAYGRTGELTLTQDDQRTICHWRRGALVLASCFDPAHYIEDSSFSLSGIPKQVLSDAEAEQRQSSKPVYVSLAEAGALPSNELPELLREQSKRVMLHAIEKNRGRFVWKEQLESPLYVDAYGRALSTAQLTLERARNKPSTGRAVDAAAIYDRDQAFSKKLRQLQLTPSERRVLMCVDGRTTVAELIARAGLDSAEATVVLARLAEIELIRLRGAAATGPSSSAGPRTAMILEPDRETFTRPLAELLGGRNEPLTLVELDPSGDWAAQLAAHRPQLLILNTVIGTEALDKTTRAIRSTLEISDLPIVAIQEVSNVSQAEQLVAAGVDAVFAKPVFFGDLERLLVQ